MYAQFQVRCNLATQQNELRGIMAMLTVSVALSKGSLFWSKFGVHPNAHRVQPSVCQRSYLPHNQRPDFHHHVLANLERATDRHLDY